MVGIDENSLEAEDVILRMGAKDAMMSVLQLLSNMPLYV